jgi:site-specific DNA recombinase
MYTEKKTLKSAFYIRVSTEDQADMNGRELQLSRLKALIESKGLLEDGTPAIKPPENEHIYIDEISGTVPLEERPAFHRLIEDVENAPENTKPFDIVLVYKIDRFARRLSILLDTIDFFEKYDIRFISAHESIDTSTPFGKAILGITGVIAELELATIRERTHAGRIESAIKGELLSKKYGLWRDEHKKTIIIEKEAKVIRRIFDFFVYDKYSKQKIANTLRSEKIPTPNYSGVGKPRNTGKSRNPIWFWNPNEVARILKDDIYTGDYYFNKTKNKRILPKSEWQLSPVKLPQIVDGFTFSKAQNILQNSVLTKRVTTNHQYLLSGLLRCDACYDSTIDLRGRVSWNGVSHKYNSRTAYYYQCRRVNVAKTAKVCTSLPLPASELEEYVTNYILNLIKDPKPVLKYQRELKSSRLAESELKKSENTLVSLINSTPAMKERYKEQHIIGAIATSELNAELKRIDKELIENNKKLTSVRGQLAKNHITDSYSNALELYGSKYTDSIEMLKKNKDELYNLIHTLVEEIVVYTRDARSEDKIAGKKKANQQVPFRLEIKLRLPQDFLAELVEEQEKLYKEERQKELLIQQKWEEKHSKPDKELRVKNHSW